MQDADEETRVRLGGIVFLVGVKVAQQLWIVWEFKDCADDGLLRGGIEHCAGIAAEIVESSVDEPFPNGSESRYDRRDIGRGKPRLEGSVGEEVAAHG